MTRVTNAAVRPYHHGNLRSALIQAGVELATEGGPTAVVLREVARRVGVSPNAAYRHFADLPELTAAVAGQGMAALAAAMRAELADCVPTGDPAHDAAQRLQVVGWSYVRFALAQPGLFAASFHGMPSADVAPAATPAHDDPYDILNAVLDELLAAGALSPAVRPAAPITAWAMVHGLSTLLLGPLSALAGHERDALIDACLDQVLTGLLVR